jgi:hypothetical protein
MAQEVPVLGPDSQPEVGDKPDRWVPPVSGEKQKKKKNRE